VDVTAGTTVAFIMYHRLFPQDRT